MLVPQSRRSAIYLVSATITSLVLAASRPGGYGCAHSSSLAAQADSDSARIQVQSPAALGLGQPAQASCQPKETWSEPHLPNDLMQWSGSTSCVPSLSGKKQFKFATVRAPRTVAGRRLKSKKECFLGPSVKDRALILCIFFAYLFAYVLAFFLVSCVICIF